MSIKLSNEQEYFSNRQKEKQLSRHEDELVLFSGKKTREELQRENGSFAFPIDSVSPVDSVKILWPKVKNR